MKITILVDNYVTKRNFIAEHGFSALIEDGEKRILFDTGQGYALMHNLKVKNIDPKTIKMVILSHGHDDHTGGLEAFYKENNEFELIAHPDVVYPKFKIMGEVKQNIGLKIGLSKFNKHFSKVPFAITPYLIFSGEVPKINQWELEEKSYYREKNGKLEKDPFTDDVSLFIPLKDKKLLVLTGCAHSGIINIIQYGMKVTGMNKLYGVIGGMHLKNASKRRIERTAEMLYEMDPSFITLSHCTGIPAGIEFTKKLKDRVIFTDVSKEFKYDMYSKN